MRAFACQAATYASGGIAAALRSMPDVPRAAIRRKAGIGEQGAWGAALDTMPENAC